MYPLFRSTGNMIMALAVWSIPTAGAFLFIKYSTSLSWLNAAILAIPPMLPKGFSVFSSGYLCRILPLDLKKIPRLLFIHSCAALLLCSCWLLLIFFYALLLDKFVGQDLWLPAMVEQWSFFAIFGIILYFLGVTVHYLEIAMRKTFVAEQKVMEERVATAQAELRALKAGIHPHFLFNSLTALSSLIPADPDRARRVCLDLADFLRYSLHYNQQTWVTLREEVEHLTTYLRIEQIRLEQRLQVIWQIDSQVDSMLLDGPVLALILQPLAENAIKHGIQQYLEGGEISININRHEIGLEIVITNPAPPPDARKAKGNGMGIKTLQARLDFYYRGKARLILQKQDTVFRTRLLLPLNENNDDDLNLNPLCHNISAGQDPA